MKRCYESPRMTVHGRLEQITQTSGNNATRDVLILNGVVLAESDDSFDFCLPDATRCDV